MPIEICDETKIHYGFILENMNTERWMNRSLTQVMFSEEFLNFTKHLRRPLIEKFIKQVDPRISDQEI